MSQTSYPAATREPLIAVERATYRYQARNGAPLPSAIDEISLRVASGEYVALLGHNGSGKSTLARLLNGLLVPESGHVLVLGHDTRERTRRRLVRERVGMIFSDPDSQIIATLVSDDVAWGLAARGLPRHVIASRVDTALAAVGLAEARGRAPHELSGGQRQRLAIAGVLALEPACIVADEVTAQLDPQARAETLALLRDLNRTRGLSVVAVTHLLEEAALADRVIVLEHGRIALEGAPAVVFADLERLRALRLVVPEVALLGERLRRVGLPIPPDAITPEALVAALSAMEGQSV
jgi:energy-coupling factor transport system ATP-binding protein